jgi:hypothetical protein
MKGLMFIGKPENRFENYLDSSHIIGSQNTICQHTKCRFMDTIVKDDVKSKLILLKDEILQETIDKTFWQFVIKRESWVVHIRQKENDPFCEIWFANEYSGDDLIKLKGFLKDQQFLLEIKKLVTASPIYYFLNIQNEELHGYYIITRCFVDSNTIKIDILDGAIRNVINYGVLVLAYIDSKIRKGPSEQQTKPSLIEENKSYS